MTDTHSLPGPSDEQAWADPATVYRIARVSPAVHVNAHPKPVFDCPHCPPAVCPECGALEPECADPSGHARAYASSETTWRQIAARPPAWKLPPASPTRREPVEVAR